MTPRDLGLPAKFVEFRESQLRKLEELLRVDSTFNGLNLPTGFGKTSFYVGYSRILSIDRGRPVRTVILTGTKALQDQISHEFKSMGLADIRGRNNYRCPLHGTCDRGHEYECYLSTTLGCKYTAHVDAATRSELISANYSYWLSARNNSPTALEPKSGLAPIDLLICDEAHQIFDELARHLSIHIPYEWCGHFPLHDKDDAALVGTQDRVDSISSWVDVKLIDVKRAQAGYEDLPNYTHNREWMQLERLRMEFRRLKAINSNWIYRAHDSKPTDPVSGMDFDCLWPGPYANRLWSNVPKVVLVSGTLTPYSMRLNGVPSDAFYTYEKSTFPANRCPIIHVPTVKLNHASTDADYRAIINRVDEITGGRLDRKGIIHTVSYDRAATLIKYSKYAQYMHSNKSSRNITDLISTFKRAEPPALLVGPSVTTGVDFPDTDAEYIIIIKVPYPDKSDILMKERCKSDKKYYTHVTVQTLVQMCGRGMRHEDDRCEVFIIDNSITLLKVMGSQYAPPGFFDSPRYRVSLAVPKPPPKLVCATA